MWNPRAGILGCHKEPAGEASVGPAGDRPAGGRQVQDRARRRRSKDRMLGFGAGVAGPGPPVRGHGEVKDISALGRGAGMCGCLDACWEAPRGREAGAAAAGLGAGSRPGALGCRALGGRVRGLGHRPRQGAVRGPRGVSELGSRGAETPPRCEPRLRGGGRPGPPSASHRRRHSLPGLPGPRNVAAVAGGALPEEGEGAIAVGPAYPPQPFSPLGSVLGGPVAGWSWKLEPFDPTPRCPRPPREAAFSRSQEPGSGFQKQLVPLFTCVALIKSLNLSGPISISVKRDW